MREFKDKADNVWKIDLNIGTVMRVRRDSDKRFDLFEMGAEGGLYQRLLGDEGEVCELLMLLVEPQVVAKGLTMESFGELMAGDCFVEAKLAFFHEWQDFFRQRQRPREAELLRMMTLATAKAVEVVKAQLANDTEAIDKLLTTALTEAATKSSSALQHALASSTPPRTRSAACGGGRTKSSSKRGRT